MQRINKSKSGKMKIGQVKSNEGWMLTFADLLSLLLTFFVLVFSMSTIQTGNWGDIVETMNEQFSAARSAVMPKRYEENSTIARSGIRGLNLNYLQALIERSITQSESFKDASVFRENDRVIISVPASGLFDKKDGIFIGDAVDALSHLAGSLVQIKNKLMIAAHTNDQPVLNGKYRSNWELSVTRAQLVAGVMADQGYLQPITVVGHGDSKFTKRGARASLSELNAQERIDFILINEGTERGPFDVF